MCAETYKNKEDLGKRRACETVYDEIMKRGLTSTMYMIFNYAQQLNVRFMREQDLAGGRTQKFLFERLLDVKLKDLVDLLTYFVHDTLNYMDDIVTKTALLYFE